MAKLLIFVLLIVTLFFGTHEVETNANQYDCYEAHPEIPCDGYKATPKCVSLCKRKLGSKANATCIAYSQGFICACSYPC
ncbi:hypothetical protein EJD97_007225 [Solanum chilense]|uniref:Knottin scorpion toxin-like domain-containing protein n=1 Tax=Solanum chilense TaxID=4083 RepID=A0A6N2AJV1_SOLCI|nr:hypothetical protein EJD97_007225 [Solanum chilense]